MTTQMNSFGASGRVGHDSTKFYGRKMFNGNTSTTLLPSQSVPDDTLGKIYCHSSENMRELPDRTVHLMVTSPPYNVGKEYDDDLTLQEYIDLLHSVFRECYRVLVDGGRACVNVANVGRKPYIALNALVANVMLDIGYLMRGEIIWNKSASAGVSCAWGSWMSASNPVLRDVHEYILVFSKNSYSKPKQSEASESTIARAGFLDWTKSIWEFPAESARRVGHPAPFPVQLPLRLIQLYSHSDDVVLDPFMGSGSTALACVQTNRKWIGYDVSKQYCDLTDHRIANYLKIESTVDSVCPD